MIGYVKLWFVFLFIVLAVNTCNAQPEFPLTLAQDGESNYEIYISPDADSTLKAGVANFQKYISKIGGVKLPITNTKKSSNQIVVGDSSYIRTLAPDIPFDKVKKDGFIIRTEGYHLLISGIHSNGTINGLYHFLEKYLGCRYYSKDAVKIPKKKKITIDAIDDLENPAFDLRILHSFEAFSEGYSKWHKLDLPPRVNPVWAKPWVHTTTRFVDPEKYYSEHPEYYMLWDGKRVTTDIDWSSKGVLNIILSRLNKIVEKVPSAQFLGVSQADHNHNKMCEGQKCSSINQQESASSGAIIRFVNKVARKFPDKTITTLAYHYSQKPPLDLKPEDNVLVILTNYREADIKKSTYPINNDKSEFIADLKGWQGLTDNIMIWDYVANLGYPLAPFPNLFMLQTNFKTFTEMGINKMFVQSNSRTGSEFQELRSYLLSKLLWDPFLDVESVMDDFLKGYYGDAAPYIKEYIVKMTERMDNSGNPLSRRVSPYHYKESFLFPSALEEYDSLFDKATESVAENDVLRTRIDKARQSLRYAKLEIYKARYKNQLKESSLKRKRMSTRPGPSIDIDYKKLLNEFVKKAKKYETTKIGPRNSNPDSYMKSILE